MDQPKLTERLIGPATTIIVTLFYHWFVVLGHAPVTVAILFPFVVLAAFTSGMRAGMVAALWVSGYSAWLVWTTDPLRAVVVAASLIATNHMVGLLKRRSRIAEETRRKAELADAVNGNIEKLRDIEKSLFELLMGWQVLNDEAQLRIVKVAHSNIANLTSIVSGWRELWKERETLIEEHEKRQ